MNFVIILETVITNSEKKQTELIQWIFPYKNKRKRKGEQILGYQYGIEKAVECVGDSDAIHTWSTWNSSLNKRLVKEARPSKPQYC